MHIKITLKDPDGVWESLTNAAERSVSSVDGLSTDEKAELISSRKEQFDELCSRWIQYGEYVTITIDTDAKTATVNPVN